MPEDGVLRCSMCAAFMAAFLSPEIQVIVKSQIEAALMGALHSIEETHPDTVPISIESTGSTDNRQSCSVLDRSGSGEKTVWEPSRSEYRHGTCPISSDLCTGDESVSVDPMLLQSILEDSSKDNLRRNHVCGQQTSEDRSAESVDGQSGSFAATRDIVVVANPAVVAIIEADLGGTLDGSIDIVEDLEDLNGTLVQGREAGLPFIDVRKDRVLIDQQRQSAENLVTHVDVCVKGCRELDEDIWACMRNLLAEPDEAFGLGTSFHVDSKFQRSPLANGETTLEVDEKTVGLGASFHEDNEPQRSPGENGETKLCGLEGRAVSRPDQIVGEKGDCEIAGQLAEVVAAIMERQSVGRAEKDMQLLDEERRNEFDARRIALYTEREPTVDDEVVNDGGMNDCWTSGNIAEWLILYGAVFDPGRSSSHEYLQLDGSQVKVLAVSWDLFDDRLASRLNESDVWRSNGHLFGQKEDLVSWSFVPVPSRTLDIHLPFSFLYVARHGHRYEPAGTVNSDGVIA